MSSPLVSVIIPVYNGAAFIITSMTSVKDQSWKEWECIIVDDGSKDNTGDIVKGYIAGDDRFKYVYQPNAGLSAARNTGLDHAKGDIIQFLDADDVILPLKLEKQLPHFRSGEQKIVSYVDYSAGQSEDIYTPLDYYTPAQLPSRDPLTSLVLDWESGISIPPHCFLFNAWFFREGKIRFDTSLPNHEDFDCWLSILQMQPVVKYLDEKLCIYRITQNSMSKKMRLMGEGFLQVLNKHIQLSTRSASLRRLLFRKRREVLKAYQRWDLMTWKERFLSIGRISKYYRRRILQKAGLST